MALDHLVVAFVRQLVVLDCFAHCSLHKQLIERERIRIKIASCHFRSIKGLTSLIVTEKYDQTLNDEDVVLAMKRVLRDDNVCQALSNPLLPIFLIGVANGRS